MLAMGHAIGGKGGGPRFIGQVSQSRAGGDPIATNVVDDLRDRPRKLGAQRTLIDIFDINNVRLRLDNGSSLFQ